MSLVKTNGSCILLELGCQITVDVIVAMMVTFGLASK